MNEKQNKLIQIKLKLIEKQTKIKQKVFFWIRIAAIVASVLSTMSYGIFIGILAYLAIWVIFYTVLFIVSDPHWK
jgi:hypothetical protein